MIRSAMFSDFDRSGRTTTSFAGVCRIAAVVAAILLQTHATRAATIRTIDDKLTDGALQSLAEGRLVVQPSAGGAVVQLPLDQIVEIRLKEAAKPAPSTPAPESSADSGGKSGFIRALGSFFSPTPPSSPAPADATPTTAAPSTATPTTEAPATDAPATAAPATESSSTPAATTPAPAQPTAKPTVTLPVATPTTTEPSKPAESSAPTLAPVPDKPSKPADETAEADNDAAIWKIELTAGDHLLAALAEWSGDRVALRLDGADHATVRIPVDRLREVWSTDGALVKKAKALSVSQSAQDVAYVEKDGQVKSVSGVVGGVRGGELLFKFEGAERKIKLARLVGLVLAQRELPPEKSLYQTLSFVNGDTLSGRLESLRDNTLRLTPLAGAAAAEVSAVEIQLDRVASIDVKNGRLTWLSDLTPVDVKQTPYFDRLMPFRVNESLTGGPVKLADGTVTKGIAVHTQCDLTYDIGGEFQRLRTKVGFQQPEGKLGRAVVRIVGDGKPLWENTDLRGDAAKSEAVDLDVSGVKSLRLEADFGPNYDVAGRVVWGEARLVRSGH